VANPDFRAEIKGRPPTPDALISPRQRFCIVSAALMALFLGALDALVMSAAMPTIVAELGGLHLYSWVYSTYLLSRAIALPIFGKLADLFKVKILFIFSIGIFLISSIMAGSSPTMSFLIVSRVFQGIGSGGIFALVYIVLADITAEESRGKALSLASVIWGIASVLGPSLGGFIVTFFSWRWIFFINIPVGIISLIGIGFYLIELRAKKKEFSLDVGGIVTLVITILGFLTAFVLGGDTYHWFSPQVAGLMAVAAISGFLFCIAEKGAKDPILPLGFFENRGFGFGNGAAFLSSFAVFSLFAFAPIFIQGALRKTPLQVGMAMLTLSLGWSLGALVLGYVINYLGKKNAAVIGAVCLVSGSILSLTFNTSTPTVAYLTAFLLAGVGMGFVTLATLLIVQGVMAPADLGIATASNQFSRTLGGTVGVGICGAVLNEKMADYMETILNTGILKQLPLAAVPSAERKIETLFRPEILDLLNPETQKAFQESVADGVWVVFWVVLIAAVCCLGACLMLPKASTAGRSESSPR